MNHLTQKLPMYFYAISLCLLAGACAHNEPAAYKSSAVKDIEVDSNQYGRSVVLNFALGSSQLSAQEQIKLQNIVSNVGADDIDKIELAAWSDKEFPRTGKSLSKPDRDLVTARINTVKDFLKTNMTVPSVKAYNMAETSNWLARTFRTDDAEMKSVFSKDADVPMAREDFNTIVRNGVKSKAVVVIIRKK